jgi:hypothetical protein
MSSVAASPTQATVVALAQLAWSYPSDTSIDNNILETLLQQFEGIRLVDGLHQPPAQGLVDVGSTAGEQQLRRHAGAGEGVTAGTVALGASPGRRAQITVVPPSTTSSWPLR